MWLGFDIGGTKLALAVGGSDGRLVGQRRRPMNPSGDPRRDVDAMVAAARELLAEAGVAASALKGVGLAVPGPVDVGRGSVEKPPNLPGWDSVPLAAWVAEAFGAPVHLENDANAAALAEWRFGAGRGAGSLVYLTMSTGVGGGLVLDGRLYRGPEGRAGEVGHIPVEWEGEPCGCGKRGCLEAYCGGRRWSERLAAVTPTTSRVAELAGSTADARPEHVIEAAREGDAFALVELERWNGYLVRGLVALGFALTPECFVLGTIAVAAGEALCFEPVRRGFAERIWPTLGNHTRIVPAELGDDAPYLAALCAAFEARAPD